MSYTDAVGTVDGRRTTWDVDSTMAGIHYKTANLAWLAGFLNHQQYGCRFFLSGKPSALFLNMFKATVAGFRGKVA